MSRTIRGQGAAFAATALALVLLVFAAYWPGRGGGFVFDDFPNLVDNEALRVAGLDWRSWIAAAFSSAAGPLARPLAMASFAANHFFTGMDPVPMKLTNIAIHALNAVLCLGLVRALLALAAPASDPSRREWAARFTAAAWALHPINLMAVLFVVQRMESLSHAFVLAGLWLYVAGRSRQLAGVGGGGWRLVAGVVGGTALGVLAKESAILLPLYAATIEACLLGARGAGGRRDRRLLAFHGLVLVLPALAGLAWLLPRALSPVAYASRDFGLGERLLTEGRVVVDYLRWTLAPSLRQLSLYHDDYAISHGWLAPASTLAAFLFLAALAAAAWWLRRRRPLVCLGIAWFLGAQALTASFVPLELVYEHRNYFASLGVCLAVADLLLLAPGRDELRRLGVLVAGAWLAWLALTTHLRAREWSDPLRFAATEAAKHPASPRATYAYAQLLAEAAQSRPGSPLLAEAMAALERASALPGGGIAPYSALLVTAARNGLPLRDAWWDGMIAHLRAHPVGPEEASAIASLATCARDGRCDFPPAAMLAVFQASQDRRPNAEVLNIYADYVTNVLRQPEVALYLWGRAIAMKPREAQYRINRCKLLIALGRFDEARADIRALRGLGLFGQHARDADALALRLARARPAAARRR